MEVDADVQPQARAGDAAAESRLLRRAGRLLAVYWLLMFIGTHVRLTEPSVVVHIRDKVVHLAAFAGLAFLVIHYQRSRKGDLTWLDLVAVWLLVGAYGVFDELTQIPVGRTADPLDWLADVAGAATGLVAYLIYRAKTSIRH